MDLGEEQRRKAPDLLFGADLAQAAGVDEIVMGVSGTTGAEVQLERLAMAWGMLEKKDGAQSVMAKVVWEGRELSYKL